MSTCLVLLLFLHVDLPTAAVCFLPLFAHLSCVSSDTKLGTAFVSATISAVLPIRVSFFELLDVALSTLYGLAHPCLEQLLALLSCLPLPCVHSFSLPPHKCMTSPLSLSTSKT
ncbi:hypothetical protein PF005_g1326 [Phytophthora fragariae]|uniref:Secreted protein n=1 Tax=Phytophthora fragariae TaxID=53985 RepID=A0A6A3FSJ1_9STRA|nr:hypothetical protein PF003_g25972 [Phytophthora fragariae]KAE8949104.1 hypothetical protein PF009_g1353 [Phytophthora fragariae]KAE8951667.1 hypothetical protein PF011_g32902 [Phytophthora fragariae]KAE9138098.1 hypothetical protein PF010_g1057 [Phytophthora fragariae]KAE9138102.1 hypothetical protein PF010_g1053 [Phytophthora fragariae]